MPKIILCKSYANHIYDYDYITSIFFFILVFHGKNRYFHFACMCRKNFIRGKRGPVYDMEYYNSWNVNHLTLDYNNPIYTPIDSNIPTISQLGLENNKFQKNNFI